MKVSAGSAVLPERRGIVHFGGAAVLWLYVCALVAAVVGLYAFGVQDLPAVDTPLRLPWWALALFFYLAEAFVIHLHFRSEAHSLSLSECGLVLGLFFASPEQLLLGQLLGAFAALAFHRRQRPIKVAFNLAQFALTTCVALVVFRALTDPATPTGPDEWVAALAGAVIACALGVVLVAGAITLARGQLGLRSFGHVVLFSLLGTVVNASLAVAAVRLIESDWRGAWLLALPLGAFVAIYRMYNVHRRRYEHLEFLYESMRAIQEAPQFALAVRRVLESAQQLIHAEFAEAFLISSEDGGRGVRSTLAPDRQSMMQPSELTPLEHIALTELGGHGALRIGRGSEGTPLDGYLAERGLRDAVVAPLRGESRVLGLMVIGNRAGDVGTFNEHDRKLCETFASHASVLLENDRLERSISELTELKEQLHHQAYHDSLTGLPNRALFAERVAESLRRGERPTVLFIDLDEFKTINDSLGHAIGDQLLGGIASRVRSCMRPTDTPARIGGDELAVLVPAGSSDNATMLAERLIQAVCEPMTLGGRQVSVHASIGIARAEGGTTADELLQNADLAMYSAKTSGKRRFASYDPRMHEIVRERHELSSALELALERNEIAVRYQPIVDLQSGKPAGLEALVRWQHPERGLIGPAEFVPLAVETRLIIPIGLAVLRESCRQLAEWRRTSGRRSLFVAVNLSAEELQNPHLVREVESILADTGLPASALSLEITESGAMQDPVLTIERMRMLRGLGVRLALDDFGTGYSSLGHLSEFPIDQVKIAKRFVDRLDVDAVGPTFVETIVRLADALGLVTVAEGIETRGQADQLKRLTCSYGQGFHFATPLEPAQVARYLNTGLRLVA